MSNWKPISEAPKGEPCICWNGNDIYILTSLKEDGLWREPANLLVLKKQPTHYMELPKPPIEEKENDK